MISATNAFITAVGATSRQWKVRLILNGSALSCTVKDITIYKGACGEEIKDGTVYASYAELGITDCSAVLEHQTLAIQFGLGNDYIMVGTYEVIVVDESTDTTRLTAYGALSTDCGGTYSTELTYPAAVTSVITELSTAVGKTVSLQGITATGSILQPPTGTNRDALASVAAFLGGFVTDTADGNIVIAKYGSGGTKIVTTSMVAEAVIFGASQTVNSLPIESAEVDMLLGDPRVEAFDKLTVDDLSGNSHTVLPVRIVHRFDGGISSTIDGTFPSEDSVDDVYRKGAISATVTELVEVVGELETEVDDARKIAVNYLAFDENDGLMVADMTDGQATPSTATGRNVLIDSDSVDIRNGQDVLASFGETVRVGAEDTAHIDIESGRMLVADSLGSTMAEISKGSDTPISRPIFWATSQRFSVGDILRYEVIGSPSSSGIYFEISNSASEIKYVTLSGSAGLTKTITMTSLTGTVTFDGRYVVFEVSTSTGTPSYFVTIEYDTSFYPPTFRMGSGVTVSGGNSAVFGEGTTSGKVAQFVVGTYNKEDREDITTRPDGVSGYGQYAVIVGNGSMTQSLSKRSNALAVQWGGEIEVDIDTSQSAGTTDGDLYAGLDALGWDSILT